MDQKILKQFEILLAKALKNVITKDDLKAFATKGDILALEKRFEHIFATKDDLKAMEIRLIQKISDSEAGIIGMVDKHKADKVQTENIAKRVDRIETELRRQN